MGQGLSDLVNTLFLLLPYELAIVLIIGVAILFLPGWLFAMRSKQIKGLIRRRVRATEEARGHLAEQALELAAGKGDRLVILAREALKMGQRDLWKSAMDELKLLPAHSSEVQELTSEVSREGQPLLHPVEVIMTVKRLRELGMNQAALERIEEAIQRFPQDEELLTTRNEVLSSIETSSTTLEDNNNFKTHEL